MYSCHLLWISSVSVRSITFLYFIVPPQEPELDFLVSVQESPTEAWVDSGLQWHQGHWIQQSCHKFFWRSPTATYSTIVGLRPNYMKETQLHPSIENWITDLLSMAPPITAFHNCWDNLCSQPKCTKSPFSHTLTNIYYILPIWY